MSKPTAPLASSTIKKNSDAAAVPRRSAPAVQEQGKFRARRSGDLDPVKFWALVIIAGACVGYGVIAKFAGWL